MEKRLKLNQMIYGLIKTQIEFGMYGFGSHLPPIEEMASMLMVSADTVRSAYHRLQKDGYLTLSKRIGTVVNVQYDETEIEKNIQIYFAERKEYLFDLCASMPLLFSGVQVSAWKSISKENLNKLERLISQPQLKPAFWLMFYLQAIYGSLENNLLTSLIRKLSSTYMLPFLSLVDYEEYVCKECCSIPEKIELCRQEDWTTLRAVIRNSLENHFCNITNFYKTRITFTDTKKQFLFTWNSYNKASQICYSVGFEILNSITLGNYPEGTFLPSLKNLAEEKQVSVSTIRHTLALLNDLGVVKTINGIGTKVLSANQAAENFNPSSPAMQKRLLDCKQSLQLLALSCRDAAASAVSSADEKSKLQWINELYSLKRLEKYDLIGFVSIRYISQSAPYQTIRAVYTELYKHLFWGTPLRILLGSQETLNAFYIPYYYAMADALKSNDAGVFAAKLEEIINYNVETITQQLKDLGIRDDRRKPPLKA